MIFPINLPLTTLLLYIYINIIKGLLNLLITFRLFLGKSSRMWRKKINNINNGV